MMWQRQRSSGFTLMETMIVLAILVALVGISWPALMRPWSRSLAQQAAQQLTIRILEARTHAVEQSRVYRLRWRPGSGEFQIDAPFSVSGGSIGDRGQLDASRSRGTLSSIESTTRPSESRTGSRSEAPNERLNPSSDSSGMPTGRMTGVIDTELTRRPAPHHVSERLENDVRFPADRSLALGRQAVGTSAGRQQPETLRDTKLATAPLTDSTADSKTDSANLLASEPHTWSDPIWFYPDGRTTNGHWTLRSEDGYEVDVFLRGLTGTVRVGRVHKAPVDTMSDPAAPDEEETDDQEAGASSPSEY